MLKNIKYKILISFILIAFAFSFSNHESYNESSIELQLDKPYILVTKELATKQSLEKTIEDNDAKLVSKEWESFVVEVPKRIIKLREYELLGKLNFSIEKESLDLGNIKLNFEQNIDINKNIFKIDTKLKESQKNVLVLNKLIEISPFENKTKLIIKSEIKIKKIIPFFAKKIMDKKVEEYNKKDLENLKNKLLSIINSKPEIKFERKLTSTNKE